MKKRIALLSLVLVLTTVVMGLAGCAGNEQKPGENERIRITIWTIATRSDSFYKPFTEAIAEYNNSQDQYLVEMVTFENDQYKAKLPNQVKANQLPDIFYTWAGGFSQAFVDAGKVLELDSYYEKYKDDLPENKLTAIYNGKLYGVPYVTPISVVFYNKKAFEEAGISKVPETLSEWLNCCEKLKAAGFIPIGNATKSDSTWVIAMLHDAIALKTVGAERLEKVLTSKGREYSGKDFVEAARIFRSFFENGYVDPEAEEINNDQALAKFYNGKSGMYVMGSWQAGLFYNKNNCQNPEDFDFFPVPVINADCASITDYMGGAADTLMVNRYSEHADVAADIAFRLAKAVSRKAYISGAGSPAWNVDYNTSAVLPLPKKIAEACEEATSFTLWFDTLMLSEDTDVYLNSLAKLCAGEITPEEFAETMASQLNK